VMISANAVLNGSYNYGEVARSLLVAIAGSYAALDLAGRVTAASGRARARWRIGIWEMDFKGLLAFRLPIPVAYHWPTVLVSFVVAVSTSAMALLIVSRQEVGAVQLSTSSLSIGSGIAALHYIDMASMRMGAVCRYDLPIVILSIALAIAFSFVAMTLAFGLGAETMGTPWRRIASALVMGAAISATHYTGLASATFIASPVVPNLSHTVSISPLANFGVALITLLVLSAAIVTSSADRQAKAEVRRVNERLEQRVAERTRQLEAVNETLRKEIVERERAEQSLRLFRMLIDQSNDAFEVVDPDTLRYIDVNGKACLDLGYTREELLSLRVIDIDPAADESRAARVRGELQDAGSIIFESFHRRKDGSTFPVEVSLRQVQLDRRYMVSVVRNITERKRAEEALKKSEEKFSKAFRLSPMAITLASVKDHRFLEVNEAFERVTGWRRDQVIGRTPFDMELWVNPAERVELVKRILTEGCLRNVEVRLRRKDGAVFIGLGTAEMIELNGEPCTINVFTDITERKRAEAALRDAQAELAHVTRVLAMGELVASIAHEVYQPLTAVLTTSNFVLRQLANMPNCEDVQKAVTEIVEDANRISAVISRVRTLLSRGVPDRVELDINDVIEEVTVIVRGEAAQNQIHLELDLGVGLPHIMGDRVQLQQVLINLIVNGIDAMRSVTGRPRNLDITSAKRVDGVLIRVQDSGTGVDPDNLERIFEPFFTTKRQGIGMGLSISRSIIESHGGRLWTEPGSLGAIFEFTLPTKESSVS
jgi:PAS domain S-box-containing protein